MWFYLLLIFNGILSCDGFSCEFCLCFYEKFNFVVFDVKDFCDIFFLLFNDKYDGEWINSVLLYYWGSIFKLFNCYVSEVECECVDVYLRVEGLFVIKMFLIWIVVEEM